MLETKNERNKYKIQEEEKKMVFVELKKKNLVESLKCNLNRNNYTKHSLKVFFPLLVSIFFSFKFL